MNPTENTPTTQRVLRQRHTPTPKMSERKKALFAATKMQQQLHMTPSSAITTIDEDSDLGPMSPLQFSCSPSSYSDPNSFFKQSRSPAVAAPTDFRNIMQQLSPCRRASDQYEAVYITTPTKRRTSPRQTTTVQPQTHADLEKENFSGQLPAEVQQTTPSVPTSRSVDTVPRVSHRKSLIFDTGLTPTATVDPGTVDTPRDSATVVDQTPDTSRARASLTFSADSQTTRQPLTTTKPGISARSFYGSSYCTPTAAAPTGSHKPPTPPSASCFRAIARRRASMPASAVTAAADRRRSRNAQPRLSSGGNRGRSACHRISKPKLPAALLQSQAASVGRPHGRKFANRAEVISAALALIENHATVTQRILNNSTVAGQQHATDDNQITQHQIEKLQRILTAQRSNAYSLASKQLNWLGGGRADRSALETTLSADMDNTFGHMSVLDSTALNETVASDETAPTATTPTTTSTEPPQKRKFFKSDTVNANKYTVMKGMCVSMKRGIGVQTLSPPQPLKKPRHSHAEYAELRAINREVTDIIDMLETIGDDEHVGPSAPAASTVAAAVPDAANAPGDTAIAPLVPDALASRRHYEHFERQLPYNTSDPETQQRQRTLLSMLDTHHICCERTFRIFIAEPLCHEAEASQILDQLFQLDVVQTAEVDGPVAVDMADGDEELQMEPLRDGEETESTASMPLSPASQISTLTSAMELGSPTTTMTTATTPTTATNADKMFPIFCRDTAIADEPADRPNKSLIGAGATKAIAWRAYGRDARQLQIDAGQRSFGGTQCSGCGMFYARHEPEDEALHQRYHDLSGRLLFRGWQDERLVSEVPEWGAAGRIVCVQRGDGKAKRARAAEIVRLVDEALGVPRGEAETGDQMDMGAQSVIYLAIARRQVVGVCVAEPLHTAHPVRLQPGGVPMMELEQTRLVRCGLSRMWVIEAFRRHGIGRRLFEAVRGHFCRGGYVMGLDEVAFGSPTEAGCAFAARMVGDAADVLVY